MKNEITLEQIKRLQAVGYPVEYDYANSPYCMKNDKFIINPLCEEIMDWISERADGVGFDKNGGEWFVETIFPPPNSKHKHICISNESLTEVLVQAVEIISKWNDDEKSS